VFKEAVQTKRTFEDFLHSFCMILSVHFSGVEFTYMVSSYIAATWSPLGFRKCTPGSHDFAIKASWMD